MQNANMTAVIGARITEYRKKMAEVNKIMRKTATAAIINVKARTNEAQNKLDRIAKTLNTIQTITSNMALGSLTAMSPAAIPILAATAGGLGAVVSYLGMAGVAAVAFGGVAIPVISKLFDETTKLTSVQKAAKGELSKLQTTWKGITKDLEKPVLQAFSQAMQVANKTLKMARPLFDSAATAVNNLLSSMNKSLDSSPVKAFFDYMNKQGGPMLERFGKTMGNFMQGIMSMMVAFDPLTQSFSQGFLKMSESFATWAAGLSQSEKFKSFVSYVQTNGPKMLDLIGNLTTFLINLGIGMAPLGTQILDLVNKFLNWSNAMMQTNPGIAKFIGYGLVVGGVLRALGPLVITTATFFKGFGTTIVSMVGKALPIFNLLKGNMIIGLKMMVQSLGYFVVRMQAATVKIIASLGKVIAKVAVASAKFIATIVKMGARYAWLGAQALIHAARIAASWLIAMGPVGWVIATVIALVILIIANWDKVKAATIRIFGAVWSFLKSTWDKVKNVIRVGAIACYQIITDKFNQILSFVKGLGSSFLAAGKGLIDMMAKGITNAASKVYNAVQGVVQKVRNFLPFSPAKIGPLSDLDKLDFGGPIKDSIAKAKTSVQRSMTDLLQNQRTQFAFDAGLNNSDFGRIRHDIGAEVSNFEMPEPVINVYNQWDGEKVRTYINRNNAKESLITDGFGGK